MIFQIWLGSFVSPLSQFKARNYLKNSNIDFVPKFIGYSDSYVGLAHKTVEFKNLEISGPIKFKLNYLSTKINLVCEAVLLKMQNLKYHLVTATLSQYQKMRQH